MVETVMYRSIFAFEFEGRISSKLDQTLGPEITGGSSPAVFFIAQRSYQCGDMVDRNNGF